VEVATGVIARLTTLREAFVEDEGADEGEMVTLNVVGGLLVDWTDPRKIVGAQEQEAISAGKIKLEEGVASKEGATHMMLAERILERMVTSQTSSKSNLRSTSRHILIIVTEDERKVLFSMLGKLQIAVAHPDPALLRTVLELVAEATETKLATDATSRNVLSKLQTALLKLMHDFASAERGGDETILDNTAITATPGRRSKPRNASSEEEDEEDEVTQQLRREMESTQIQEAPEEELDTTHITAIGDVTTAGAEIDGYDVSQLPDDKEMQSLVDSLEDEDDDLLN